MCYNEFINTNSSTTDELVAIFLKKGGRINEYYLRDRNGNKKTLLYLKGWFSGKNMHEALLKALV